MRAIVGPSRRRSMLPALGFWLSVLVLLGVMLAPAGAQTSLVGNRPETAPIILDGRVLFQVHDSVSEERFYTAQSRAATVNQRLAKIAAIPDHELAVEVREPKKVEGREPQDKSQNLYTLRLDQQLLITVTTADTRPGGSAQEQAEAWQQTLNQALDQAKQERTLAYQQRSFAVAVGVILVAISLHFGLWWFQGRWKRWQARQPRSKAVYRLGLTTSTGAQVLLWVATILVITDQFPGLRAARYATLTSFYQPLFKLNGKEYGLFDLLFLVALVIGLWFGVRGVTLLLRSRILSSVERGTQEVISALTQYILTFLGLMVILQLAGVDVSALLIIGSALGVGIGFGLQNIVNNFISGLIILLNRPIEVGDFINLGDLVGTVERVGARSTKIRTLDQVTIIVPNAHFLEKEVMNWSHGSAVTRLHLPIGVAYGSNIAIVQKALLEAAKGHPDILAHPQPQVYFQNFGESALEFEILVWICEPRQQYRIKSDVNYRIEASLQRHGVEVPFPKRDLHVRSPQLEELLDLLVQKHQPPQPQLYYPQSQSTDTPTMSESVDLQHPVQPLQSIARSEVDYETLAEKMRGPNGVMIKDRRFRLQLYEQCFVGSEAVAWLMRTQRATKGEALRMGQTMIDRGLMHHVLDEHRFADSHLFYRFYADEELASESS